MFIANIWCKSDILTNAEQIPSAYIIPGKIVCLIWSIKFERFGNIGSIYQVMLTPLIMTVIS